VFLAPRSLAAAVATVAALAVAAPAAAQEEEPPAPGDPGFDLASWIVLEEEATPEPPLVRAAVGFVAWVENRTQIRSDRGGLRGTDLDDLEEEQGLDEGGLAPWIELSVGREVRIGADASFFLRSGEFTRQDDPVAFDGFEMADAGDLVRPRFEFYTASAFIEWDPLLGERYRIGLVGGVRYFRFDMDLEAVRARRSPTKLTRRARGELLSPFFGGLVDLRPFPYLDVRTRVQFMNWSWEEVRLKEARYLEFRVGAALKPIPDVLGIGFEFRFVVIEAETDTGETQDSRLEGALLTSGASLTIELAF